jgi:hypothetical protein
MVHFSSFSNYQKKSVTNVVALLLLLLSFIVLNTNRSSSQTIQIGYGDTASTNLNPSPVNVYYKSQHFQFIYTAAELNAGGVVLTANLLQIGFYVTAAPIYAMPNYTIKMKNTTAPNVATSDSSGLTMVYYATSYLPVAGGYDMITLDTPFGWDGTSNILVDICYEILADYSASGQCRINNITSGFRYIRSDTVLECLVPTSTVVTYRPQCQMVFLPLMNDQISLVKFLYPLNNSLNPINQTILPQIEVKNNGILDQSNFQVELHAFYPDTLTEIFSSTQTIGSISSGQTLQVTFDEFTPTDTGRYYFRAFSTFENDGYRKDDTTRTSFYSRYMFSGEYTVGNGGDFPNLATAINLINNSPVNGNIVFNIISDITETGTVQLNQITEVNGGGYTVLLRPSGGARTISRNAANTGAIILSNVDRVTIDGRINGVGNNLTIKNTNTTTVQTAILIHSWGTGQGCTDVTIRNCNLSTGKNDATGTMVALQAQGDDNDNLSVIENVITKAQTGISIFTSTTSGLNDNLVIQGNTVGSEISSEFVVSYGINVSNANAPLIKGNKVFNIYSSLTVTTYGIQLGANTAGAIITGNEITNVKNHSASTYYAYGINISSGTGTTNVEVSNNMISGIYPSSYSTTYYAAGIRIVGGTGHRIYYNSVNLYGTQVTSGIATTACLYITSSTVTGADVRNNIFSNSHSGLTNSKSYAAYVPSGTTFAVINYNDYYASGTYGIFGYYGGDKTTLAAWQTSSTQDQNSISGLPRFASNADLHIPNGTKSVVNNVGEYLDPVQIDFDEESREGTPDIGADEFAGSTPSALDVSAVSVDDPILGRSKKTSASFIPKATIMNEGTSTATSFTVTFTIAHEGQSPFYTATNNVASLASFASTQLSFTAVNANDISSGNYVATVTVTLSGDGDVSNNSQSISFIAKDALVGSFNVGVGQTYSTLTQAVNDIKDVGVSGAVTYNLVDATYNESPITISGVSGLSVASPFTIKAGVTSTINITGVSSEQWGLKIRGVEGVVIDGSTTGKGTDRSLTFNVSGLNGKYGILIDSSTSPRTQRNVVKNVIVKTGASSTISSTGYYGVWLNAAVKDTGNQIINCEITNFGEAGIRADKQQNLVLQNNYIHDWTQVSGSTSLNGIWLRTGTTNANVLGNTIANIISQVNGTTSMGIANLIGTGSGLLCANNMIYGIISEGAGATANNSRGIFSNASNQLDKYFYNSINLFGYDQSSSTTSRSAGIEFGLSATSPQIKNNIIVNTTTFAENTAEHAFGYYFVTVPTGLTSDYNDIYIPDGVVAYDGTNRTSILDWIGTGRDVNSVSANPQFVSNTDLHIRTDVQTVVESWANPTGITGTVDSDIDGNIRFGSSGYSGQSAIGSDLGADEGDFLQEFWNDATALSVDNPQNGSVKKINDTFNPIATFKNVGFRRLQNFFVNLVITNPTGDTVYNELTTIADLQIGASTQVTFPMTDVSDLANAGAYSAIATMSTDDFEDNNSTTSLFTVKGPLAGDYLVGAGGNYGTLSEATSELTILGISSAVKFTLTESAYTLSSPIVIDSISGSSAVNSFTLEGTSATLNINGTSSDSASIRLRGASNVTLRGLILNPQWSQARYGIWNKPTALSRASHNTFENCVIKTSATAATSAGYYGVLLDSLTGVKDTNNKVRNCDITQFGIAGIAVRKNSGVLIEGNTVHDWTISSGGTGTTLLGININVGSVNSIVRGNKVSNLTATVSGIVVSGIQNNAGAGSNLLCVNNMVLNVRSGGSGTSQNKTSGIYSASSSNSGDKYYFNTIILTGHSSSNSNQSYSAGFDFNVGTSTSFSIMNNNVYNEMSHTAAAGKAYCIRLNNTNGNWTSNYNNFYWVQTGEDPKWFVGQILASDYKNIDNWRTGAGAGRDVNSLQANPLFPSLTDGHLSSLRPKTPLNAAGISLPEATTDFDGDTRRSSPDIGADEVNVANVITGKKYHDIDANFNTSLDRVTLENWKIYLVQNNNVIDSQVTSENGSYIFQNLLSGTYVVQEEQAEGWTALGTVTGSGADSIHTLSTTSVEVFLSDGDSSYNNHFVNAQPGIIIVKNFADSDGRFASTADRISKRWFLSIYKDSISESSLLASGNDTMTAIYNGAPGTYVVTAADSSSKKWVTIGREYIGSSTSIYDSTSNIFSDTFYVAAGTSQEIHFVNFQRNVITVRSIEDGDGSFLFSTDDRTPKNWSLRIASLDSSVVFDTTVSSEDTLIASYLPAGTYIVSEGDTTGWVHLGIIIDDEIPGTKTTNTSDTVTVSSGQSIDIVFVNSLIKPDTTLFRTFSQSDYATKAVKLKTKVIKKPTVYTYYPVPTPGNIRDHAFARVVTKGNPMYIGVTQGTNKDSAKKYGWVIITKGATLIKLLPMTGVADSFTFKKAMKDPKLSKLNNHLVGELITFKVNSYASNNNIIMPSLDSSENVWYLDELLYQDDSASSFYHNKSLREIAKYADSLLTYSWRMALFNQADFVKLDSIFTRVNRAFLDTIGSALGPEDTLSYKPLIIRATKKLSDAEFLKRNYTPPPRNPGIQNAASGIPEQFSLEQNYPNPFNPATTIGFHLPEDAVVTISLYNVLGQKLKTIVNEQIFSAGFEEAYLDASSLSSGVYFYRFTATSLETGVTFSSMKKMMLMK